MRASTLATLDEVITSPVMTSPECTVVELSANEVITGAASGGSTIADARGTGSGARDGVLVLAEDAAAAGTGETVTMAVALLVGATPCEVCAFGLVDCGVGLTRALCHTNGVGAGVGRCGCWLCALFAQATRAQRAIGSRRKRFIGQRSFADLPAFPFWESPRPLSVEKPSVQYAQTPQISVVVPLFNEEGNVAPLIERIEAILNRLPGAPSHEIILVNDGSRDGTLQAVRAQMLRRPDIVVVNLSRNFGHQLAATAGLDVARGEAVVLMDGDLQDPPELIEAFFTKWREGYDVVYAVRRSRKGESPFKVFTARLFYRAIKRLTNVSIPVDTGDFRLMSRRVVDAIHRSPERHRFLRGLVSWVGFNQTGVEYDRDERHSGTTKYPLTKMIRFAIDGITSFSDVPLRFASYLGFSASLVAFIYAIVVIGYKVLSLRPPAYTPGWASTIVAVLFLGGVQLISLGILGEYIGRIYDEVKGRPLYLISDVERSPEPKLTRTLHR